MDEHTAVVSDRAGIVKAYEAPTMYCGWQSIEAGKTMGLFPYGKPNDKFPKLFEDGADYPLTNRNIVIPNYPNGALINAGLYKELSEVGDSPDADLTLLQSRRDIAYAVQTETQEKVTQLIKDAVDLSGKKNVVISGGYGLNCVANYHYLEQLKDDGIKIYVEPVSNDAGTAMGAAMMFWYGLEDETEKRQTQTLYLGPHNNYTKEDIVTKAEEAGVELTDATHKDVVKLITERNIVTIFQGQSENGPRALGNRSVLYDPNRS